MTLYAGRRDVAERLLGRDASGDLAVEAVRPKAPAWHLTVADEVAGRPVAVVARHVFDESGQPEGEWLVAHEYAEQVVDLLAHDDAAALVALVARKITNPKKEQNND
ncbi:hypothetical protein [Janibacter hoylei]|uniref:hypothetical protein n=1 Tax=Janibacter hoylei TaxID=364298 RepID=UPI0021A80AC2|nr:hypothetical protein [Janibacter hoylei]MCT1618756.1 hypothetical protein [Janibacter hoylei]MCT2292842.1 hypothetical protein [Janibacter hoylei]MCW4602991.1 hypothetical protein [Janibacter hoylei]